jgi:hypothetical protein
MGYAINQDMQEVFENPDKWINHGREVLINSCKHKAISDGYCEKCEIYEDSAIPMMNYLYPLEFKDYEDEKIIKVVKETNCTILENSDTGELFLALCGGGMDLSQDVGLSYIILEKWIPENLIGEIINQKGFSISEKNFKILKCEIIEQSKSYSEKFKELSEKWKNIK